MQSYFEVDFGSCTHIGRKKSNNEDYYKNCVPDNSEDMLKSGCLFIVADGVGGAAHGELASKYAAELLKHEYYQQPSEAIPDRLRYAFKKACRDIHDYAEESGRFSKMATTMVAAVVVKNTLFVANVGDSRAYLIRNGKVQQITRDHSVVEEMVRSGAMTEEEARVSSIRNQLSRSIGGEYDVEVDIFPNIPLQLGDKILLCSDGLTRYATPEDIYKMSASGEPENIAKQMVDFANQPKKGADNITVSLIEIVEKAKKHKGLVRKRDRKPDLEEWQNAETEYPRVQPVQGGKKPNLLTIILPILAVAVVALVFIALKGDFLRNILGNDEASAQLTTTPEMFLPDTTDVGEQPVQMPNGVEPLDEGQSADEMQQPQQDASSDEAGEAMPEGANGLPENAGSESAPPTQEGIDAMPERVWECVYLFQGPYLSSTLNLFGKGYDPGMKYYYYTGCVDSDGDTDTMEECTPDEPLEILDHNHVSEAGVDKWIVIYNSQRDEEEWDIPECVREDRNGKIYFLRDVGGQE